MKLHPVTDGPNKNRYCGPSALSAITGLLTDDTARHLRRVTGKRAIRGTHNWAMLRVLRQLGYRACLVCAPTRDERPTLTSWLRESKGMRTGGRVFLVVAGHHYQVISGRRFVDSKTRQIVGIKHEKVKRRARVARVWEISEGSV